MVKITFLAMTPNCLMTLVIRKRKHPLTVHQWPSLSTPKLMLVSMSYDPTHEKYAKDFQLFDEVRMSHFTKGKVQKKN